MVGEVLNGDASDVLITMAGARNSEADKVTMRSSTTARLLCKYNISVFFSSHINQHRKRRIRQ
jgi:hypothetical protein